MFGIQALWSAARYEVPVVIVVLDNREYRACKQGVDRVVAEGGADGFVGMDLAPPAIDFVALAGALGVHGRRAEGPEAIAREVTDALASGVPTLVEVPIAGLGAGRAPTEAVAAGSPEVPR
jgi:benzoylformate decarboxylase